MKWILPHSSVSTSSSSYQKKIVCRAKKKNKKKPIARITRSVAARVIGAGIDIVCNPGAASGSDDDGNGDWDDGDRVESDDEFYDVSDGEGI